MNKTISSKIIALTFGVLVITFAIAFYTIAWTEPTEAPPGGNVDTSINVGTDPQAKAGRISATEFYDYNDPDYYVNPSGQSNFQTLCIGNDCRDEWPEFDTLQMNVSSYGVGQNYYSKTVSYTCPADGTPEMIYCKSIVKGGTFGSTYELCSCSTSSSTASVKAYVWLLAEGEMGQSFDRVDYCQQGWHGDEYWYCSTVGPCTIDFRCEYTKVVGE